MGSAEAFSIFPIHAYTYIFKYHPPISSNITSITIYLVGSLLVSVSSKYSCAYSMLTLCILPYIWNKSLRPYRSIPATFSILCLQLINGTNLLTWRILFLMRGSDGKLKFTFTSYLLDGLVFSILYYTIYLEMGNYTNITSSTIIHHLHKLLKENLPFFSFFVGPWISL